VFAPHSIAVAEIGLFLAGACWLVQIVRTRSAGIRSTKLDLPIWLLFAWTVASALLSEEPRISIQKLRSTCAFLVFYVIQAVVTRRTALVLVFLMIGSGVAGTLYSILDLIRGRGVVVETIAPDSPFRATALQPGEAVWRVSGTRVYSLHDIDESIRKVPAGSQLSISVIAQGEHVEWPVFVVTDELKARTSPSGLEGSRRTHRFRASGWTRHYETFAEILQILTQLALGLALANLEPGGRRWLLWLSLGAAGLLAVGVILTAMRTVMVALGIGAGVITWRATRGGRRLLLAGAIATILICGAAVVWQTRASHALQLQDPSSVLRWKVARVGLSRVFIHPLFGHGMDAMHKHWTEWGFPGTDMLHMHSMPLQLAFDRGLPAVFLWLWIMAVFWKLASGAERRVRESQDVNGHGVLLGTTGALAGIFASSLVNYNFGAEAFALAFWWLMGTAVVLAAGSTPASRYS
jgi:hypothetical protein